MKKHLASSGLVAAAIMLVSGAAVSGSTTTLTAAELVEFTQTNHEVFTSLNNVIKVFLHLPATLHLPSVFGPNAHPPDPCFGLATAWNSVVAADQISKTQNTSAFEALLLLQATFECKVTVTGGSASGSSPAPIVSMNPVVQ